MSLTASTQSLLQNQIIFKKNFPPTVTDIIKARLTRKTFFPVFMSSVLWCSKEERCCVLKPSLCV